MSVSAKMLKDPIEIKGRQPLGFLVVEPENLKLYYVPTKKKATKKKKKNKEMYTPKTKKADRLFEQV